MHAEFRGQSGRLLYETELEASPSVGDLISLPPSRNSTVTHVNWMLAMGAPDRTVLLIYVQGE